MALRNIAISLLLILGYSVNAQNSSNLYKPYTDNDSFGASTSTLSPVNFNLMTGAVFSSGIGGGSLFMSRHRSARILEKNSPYRQELSFPILLTQILT
jgi:hypothetical protein